MWKIPSPDTTNVEYDIITALTYANGQFVFPTSPVERAEILRLYTLYDQVSGQPSPLLLDTTTTSDLLTVMHTAYSQVQIGGRLEQLRNRIKLSIEKCPYCGFGEIKDLDHHLPRSIYKAFSIYPKNLIPCCHPCNNKKRTTAGELPTSQFLHAYLGRLPDENFLIAHATVTEAGLVVNYSIQRTPEIDEHEYSRLSFQFTELNLNERFKPEINSLISSHATSFSLFSSVSPEAFRSFLQISHTDSSRIFGKNHWKTALWLALANCEDFWQGGYIHAIGVKEVAA